LVTGAQWNQLPERYGKWNSVYRFHLRWAKKGVFKELLKSTAKLNNEDNFKIIDGSHMKVHQDACYTCDSPNDQCFGKTKGDRNSKLHAMTNSNGKLLDLILRPGNEAEIKTAEELLGELSDCIVLADKGYESDVLRRHIERLGGIALIPGRKNRKKKVFYVKEVGKKRHVVENYFARIKRYRRIGTRYDRLSETFVSFICLASIMDWMR
jgi:transposase